MRVRSINRNGVQMSVVHRLNGAIRGTAIWERNGKTFVAGAERMNGKDVFEFIYSSTIDFDTLSSWVVSQLGGDEESEDFDGLENEWFR